MTLGEFIETHKDVPLDTPLAVYISDGSLDYAVLSWRRDEPDDDGERPIVISGN